jgi:hypothetical protein
VIGLLKMASYHFPTVEPFDQSAATDAKLLSRGVIAEKMQNMAGEILRRVCHQEGLAA